MSISQSVNQPASQSSASWPVNHSASQSVCQSGSQSVSQSVNDFGQKLQISFSFVLGKVGLEEVFDHHLVGKQVVLDYKILILNSGHIGFSQRGQPMILVKK